MADQVTETNANEQDEAKSTVGIRVFVYGSLKRGLHNHRVLADADFLGRCVLRGHYTMLNLGAFPGVVRYNEPKAILGEVYRISKDQLDILDMIEGHPSFYERHRIQTPWKGAWMYSLPEQYLDKCGEVDPVDNLLVWRPNDEEREWIKTVAA